MVLNSYAKINLTLSINNKLKSGLHEIQSHFCLINLSDKIEISKINKKKDQIFFKGFFAKYIKESNNSILNLLKFLRRLKLISNFYSITVTKKIPVFAGLGGGTSNAAFVLRYLFKNKINKNLINKIQSFIGSDLKLFSYKQGFLYNLKTVKIVKKKKLIFLLSHPNIKCSTRDIYSRVKKYSKKDRFSLNNINTRKKFINYILNNKNDLQPIVEKRHPIIKNY